MALEQMYAFRHGRPQSELGEIERLEPDGFPLLSSSELRAYHEGISVLLREVGETNHAEKALKDSSVQRILELNQSDRTCFYLALLERSFACDAHLSSRGFSSFFNYGPAAMIIAALYDSGVEDEKVVGHTLEWFNCYRYNYYGTPVLERAITAVERAYRGQPIPDSLREQLIAIRGQLMDGKDLRVTLENVGHWLGAKGADGQRLQGELLPGRLDALIGNGSWLTLVPCELWSQEALAQMAMMPESERGNWLAILKHCHAATGTRPSTRWLKVGQALFEKVSADSFAERLLEWLPKAERGRRLPMVSVS